MSTMDVDVAIIGGGPSGTTVGTLLKKYRPELSVAIFEREKFPRDHVGESQLPPISKVLAEMGVWDKVEAAGFPVKIGATYRWGQTPDLWHFEFIPGEAYEDRARPGRYEGQRQQLAFQVDRAIYDKILLDHAKGVGCKVYEETAIRKVSAEGDRVTGLTLDDGREVRARYYVDASGHAGILRRAMGVEIDAPTSLQNIAIWDYWQNAEWAVNIGVGGTRVQVMSLGYGWIWFIPLGPTRTSVGLVVPAEYYKASGLTPAQLYAQAIAEEPLISRLLTKATSENNLQTTKDWSFVADRTVGENWFLAGESAGFADPILAAGMTLAHMGARECAFTILELDRKILDSNWLKECYDDLQRRRIQQHIRFADFWYSANGQFTDLQAYCSQIAKDAGLDLDPQKAFQWLGTGGFANEDLGAAGVGLTDIRSLKLLTGRFGASPARWRVAEANVFEPNLEGSTRVWLPSYEGGRVDRVRAVVRDGKRMPLTTGYQAVLNILKIAPDLPRVVYNVEVLRQREAPAADPEEWRSTFFQFLESMVSDGWVTARLDPDVPQFEPEPEAAPAT
jgi:flavin-dependent dehydrogenase